MKVFGLVGEKGSGKQTFVNFYKSLHPDLKVRQVRFSDILAQTLILWDIPLTRPNLQNLAIVMNDVFGAHALADAAKFSIEGDLSDIVILDGIRRQAEYELVKQLNGQLIYITANQNLRYQRLKLRSEKAGEVGLAFEQFLEEEQSKAEGEIPKISKKADIKIDNNGSLDEFKSSILKLWPITI